MSVNQYVLIEKHPLPTIDDILPELVNSTIFSLLDLKDGFFHAEITERSKKITTFQTPKGMYRFKRLPQGICSAPEQYQKLMEKLLSGCDGVACAIDDILIHAPNREILEQRSKKVLDILEKNGLQLNKAKCQLNKEELIFLGHKLTKYGASPADSKVEAVMNFRRPENAAELKSFLGLINFVGRYIPHLATLTEPLRRLLHKGASFTWTKDQSAAFKKLKLSLVQKRVLAYYDPNAKLEVMADASPTALGAILLQKNKNGTKIVCYASKSLTDCEKRYSQTEKEALGLVWAVERFHTYLYGKRFTLLTDHKPLQVIFGPNSRPCARIQRWVLRLQSYAYDVKYIPGKSNIADPLSRLSPPSEQYNTFKAETDQYLCAITELYVPKALKLADIRDETSKDPELQEVIVSLQKGRWSTHLMMYDCIKEELMEFNGIVLRGNRIVIPRSLRKRVLDLAHEGHPGMTSMKQKLRIKVWWPKMDTDVEQKVKSCLDCQVVGLPPNPEPMKRRDLPDAPWKDIAIDFKGPLKNGQYLLVIVDYYSRFMEVRFMKKIHAVKVVDVLESVFARYGLPETITLDNGPQFNSQIFKDFCENNGIILFFTPPYWPLANGLVERQNRCISKILKIAEIKQSDWKKEIQMYVFQYHITPHSTTGATPSELFFGRKLRDKIPSLNITTKSRQDIEDTDCLKKFKGKLYSDARRGAEERNLTVGDVVLRKQDVITKADSTFHHEPYTIVKTSGPQITAESPKGKRVTRNSSFFKKLDSPLTPSEDHSIPSEPAADVDNAVPAMPSASPTAGNTALEGSSRPVRLRRPPARYGDFVAQ